LKFLLAICLLAASPWTLAQEARESLGPKDKPANANGQHPLTELMGKLHSSPRPELRGKHPRVYITEDGFMLLTEGIQQIGIVPVVSLPKLEHALPLAESLLAGRLPCAEIAFRTLPRRVPVALNEPGTTPCRNRISKHC
jgi:hypothetical protein